MKKVLVFRALMLGDMLCATPALRALRHGLPDAQITLVALPWARSLAGRLGSVDDFAAFPGWPGQPEMPGADSRNLLGFVVAIRNRNFDLAVQLHGSGAVTNPLVATFGARRMVGLAEPGADRLRRDAASFAAWPERGTELERLLALTDHLGLPRQGRHLDLPLRAYDRARAAELLAPLGGRPYVVVHAGARLASRRWPAERFAAVADALAAQGLACVLTGGSAEAGLAAIVAQAMRAPALDLAGRTTLWTLAALVEHAALVLCNDTGVSHVAAALDTPSVVVSCGADARRWAPGDRSRHRMLWHDLACRPCAGPVCPIPGHPCAAAIGVAAVRDAALQMLGVTTARPMAAAIGHA